MNAEPEELDRKQQELRSRAKALLAALPVVKPFPGDARNLQHELDVHQIELEMQNEALRQSQIFLEESRDRYIDLYDFAPVGYLTLTNEALIAEINLTGAGLLGRERSALVRHRFAPFIAAGDMDRWHRLFSRMRKQGGKQSCEVAMIRADGSVFQAYLDCLSITAGKEVSVRVAMTDITERKRAEDQLRLAATVFERTGEGIIITDPERKILTVNDAFTQVTGYTAEDVIGKTPALLKSGYHPPEFYQSFWGILAARGWWQGEIWNRRKDGELYLEWITVTSVQDEAGKLSNYVGIFSDITLIRESQRRLEFLATHDEMTSLPSRSLFLNRVRHAIARSTRHENSFAVFFVDLDNFKDVNDSLGHAAGDVLLKEVAALLRNCLRLTDTVSRFGGDEFAVLVEDDGTDAVQAGITALRIREALSIPILIGEHSLYVSASIGIALYPGDGDTVETLLKSADNAMYQAKHAGKQTHRFFTADLAEAASDRLIYGNGLSQAIERNELFLVYQPQLDLMTRKLVGIEALVRWNHPIAGLVMPGKFIPLAEETGLILKLGDWVADEACRQLASWCKAGYRLPQLSFNVSAEQFRRPELAGYIGGLIRHYDLDPSLLTVELTESALMLDPEQCRSLLLEMKALGVSLSIDDFGTGYSSLSSLSRYPIDELKIDRSFVIDMGINAEESVITRTILAMADALRLSVVAEGVETEEQSGVLRDLGCQVGQGYLFARPLSAEAMAGWLAH